jgi:hypothetical protein
MWSTGLEAAVEETQPTTESCHRRLRQCRAPLSRNQICEKLWTLPSRVLLETITSNLGLIGTAAQRIKG